MSVANILSVADSGFETWTGNWQAQPGTPASVAQSNTEAHTGSFSMALTTTLGPNQPPAVALSPIIPMAQGSYVSGNCWAWNAVNGRQVTVGVNFMLGNAVVSQQELTTTTMTASTWTNCAFQPVQDTTFTANGVQFVIKLSTSNLTNEITYIDDVVFTLSNYVTNFCPNPGFESPVTPLKGWTATDPATTIAPVTNFQSEVSQGANAMQVVTDGSIIQQGVFGPPVVMPRTSNGSMTVSLYGQTGTMNISAVNSNGGVLIGTTAVTLNGGGYQQVTATGLSFNGNDSYYILITTQGTEAITFNVDGVMYQSEAFTGSYMDGDTLNCFWSGPRWLSASFQPFQFGISATVVSVWSGAANLIVENETFPISPPVLESFWTFGQDTISGTSGHGYPQVTIVSPAASFTDFGIWQNTTLGGTDLDPAQAYCLWNNEGVVSGNVSYMRPYMMVVPPLDYPNSTGSLTWKRAAYLAPGFTFISVPNGQYQIITDVQTEMVPISGLNAVTPRAYQDPRQLQVIVKPNRLNYITNPNFASGTGNWSQLGSGQTLTTDTTMSPPLALTYKNTEFTVPQSMKIQNTTSSGVGVSISVPFLIPGATYTCSFWVYTDGNSLADITGSITGASAGTSSGDIVTGSFSELQYGAGFYGSGPYGGVPAGTANLAATWYQISFTWTSGTDTTTLSISPTVVAGTSQFYAWWLAAVMIEENDEVAPYFDGNFGADAMWEAGAPINLGRSYYYNQLQYSKHVILDALNANTPHGINYATPKYGVVPTQ